MRRSVSLLALDLRSAVRQWTVRRGSSIAAVLVGSVGVAVVVAIHSAAAAYLGMRTPFDRAAELFVIEATPEGLTPGARIPTVDEWKARTDLFQGMAAMGMPSGRRLVGAAGARLVVTLDASRNLFEVLGTRGRFPAWSDAVRGSSILLTVRGERRLAPAGDLQLETLLEEGGRRIAVDGVVSNDFLLPARGALKVDGLEPFDPKEVLVVHRWNGDRPMAASLTVIARAKSGVTASAVREALASSLPSGRRLAVRARPLTEYLTDVQRPYALAALVSGLILLAIAAGNVSNLLAARAHHRAPEFAIRRAIGASRADLVRLVAVELFVLGIGVAVAGVGLAGLALSSVAHLWPEEYFEIASPALGWADLGIACACATIVAGTAAIGLGVQYWFRHRPSRATATATVLRSRAFVVLQSGLAMVLSVGAALVLQSYWHLTRQHLGINAERLAVVTSYPASGRYERTSDELNSALGRLRRVPGVLDAAYAFGTLADAELSSTNRGVVEWNGRRLDAEWLAVSPNFMRVADLVIIEGRQLHERDDGTSNVVVSRSLAQEFWPDGSGLGSQIRVGALPSTVVGIAADIHRRALDALPQPTVHFVASAGRSSLVTFVIDADPGAEPARAGLIGAATGSDERIVVADVAPLTKMLLDGIRDRTFAAVVLGVVSGTALTVFAVGLGAMVAFAVVTRSREIALRVAIGATPRQITWVVVSQTVLPSMLGGAAGLAFGIWASRYLSAVAFGVVPGDWTTVAPAACALLGIVAVSSWLPARRALSIEPSSVLKVVP